MEAKTSDVKPFLNSYHVWKLLHRVFNKEPFALLSLTSFVLRHRKGEAEALNFKAKAGQLIALIAHGKNRQCSTLGAAQSRQ